MLLVTGATGFIGRTVVRRLTEAGYAVRTLLRPSAQSPRLPSGISMEVALSSLTDPRGVRAALVGVDTVLHLADDDQLRGRAEFLDSEIEGTVALAEAARQAGVRRILYVSHLGADRSSAYPLLRATAESEEAIRRSEIPHTIVRTSIVYGAEDHFTRALAMQLAVSPLILPLPGDGSTLLQPLWVEDLATSLLWLLETQRDRAETFEIGGPEFLSYGQILELIMEHTGMRRILVPFRPPYLRVLIWLAERMLPAPPLTTSWLDYLATSRTAELDSLPAYIGLQPSRMETRLGYLQGKNWGWELIAQQFSAQKREV